MPIGVYNHKPHSEETKRKMSLSRRGKNHPMYGRKHTAESLAKMSASHKRYRHSEESKQKIGAAHKGRMPKNIKLLHRINRGRKHKLWKGNDASYGAIHTWIRTHKGLPEKCSECGVTASEKRIEWANVDHAYRRTRADYISLCCSCHHAYDKASGLRL